MKPAKYNAVVFGDYGEDPRPMQHFAWLNFGRVIYRAHPAEAKDHRTLDDVWHWADVAVGGSSTVLVDALIHGLHVHSFNPLHVCNGVADRAQWLTDLSWAQWSFDELAEGSWWEHLC